MITGLDNLIRAHSDGGDRDGHLLGLCDSLGLSAICEAHGDYRPVRNVERTSSFVSMICV